MTRYKLPEVLGGHEVELVQRADNPNDVSAFLLRLPTESYPIHLHLTVVEEVDTTPAEPELGVPVLIGGVLCMRVTDGWRRIDSTSTWSFKVLCKHLGGPVVELAPAPEPVELPWSIGHWGVWDRDIEDDEVTIDAPGPRHYGLKPVEAEAFGLALISAARAVAREVKA